MADDAQFLGDKFIEGLFCMGIINDQIIMPKVGEFSLGGAGEDGLKVCFVGLLVRGHYV